MGFLGPAPPDFRKKEPNLFFDFFKYMNFKLIFFCVELLDYA